MKIDLFKLHNPKLDIGNGSWICLYGKGLHTVINEIKEGILIRENFRSTQELCYFLANRLNIRPWTVEQVLFNHKKWIPIPIAKELIKFSSNSNRYHKKIIKYTAYLKCNSAKSKPIKAIKDLNIELCKIAGAHAADGNISQSINLDFNNKKNKRIRIKIKEEKIKDNLNILKKYKGSIFIGNNINITEEHINAIKSYKKWIRKCFGLDVKIKHHNQKNAWRIDLNNKIICRYLTEFLNFPKGKKTYTVKEPKVIKNSLFKFRKAFLIGLMTFEGHVHYRRDQIHLISKSENLINDAKEILYKMNIPIRVRKDNYDRYICESLNLNKNQIKKVMSIFEKNTEKWQRLYEKLNGFSTRYKNIRQTKWLLLNAYPNRRLNKSSIIDLLNLILYKRNVKHKILKESLNIEKSTLAGYLKVLKNCRIISSKGRNKEIILNINRKNWSLPSTIYQNVKL